MIRNIKFITLLLLAVLVNSSCNKWLELKPQDGSVREDYWKTQEQLQAAVVGCYVALANATLVENLFIWGELRADMISTTASTTTEELDIASANILSTNSRTKWNQLYTVINNCNTVIEYGPLVLKTDNTLTQQKLNSYIAEARGLRALMYFYLLRTFGEVPLQLKAISSDSKMELLAKSSQTEVFNQIIEDLSFAELNAVTGFGPDARLNKGRLTSYAINAIQADVYLWMAGTDHPDYYAQCIKACDKVINSNSYGLIDGSVPIDWYTTLFFEGNSNESIFEIQFDSQLLNPFFGMFGNQSSKRFIAAPTLMDQVYTVDPTDPEMIKDIRGDGGSIRATDNLIWKFIGTPAINTIRAVNASYTHWFVYRYADVLLMKAEALAWTEKQQDALDLVQVIRTRARALEATEETPSVTSSQEVSDYILRERAREFAFEGKRWFDVLRHAKRNNYARLDLILSVVGTNAGSSKGELILAKYSDIRSHYLPINLDEIQADKNLVQNPYYQ